ncbi:hypothetical protein ACWDRB_47550 [Nonomuraea sp. NPDC003707]
MTSPPSDASQARPAARKTGFVLAGLFLAAVVLAGAGIVVFGGDGAPPPTPAATAATPGDLDQAATSSATPDTPTPALACGGAAGRASLSSPPQVRWDVFKSVAVPLSQQAGPAIMDGQIARCYAHNPHGALIAAWQISVRFLLADSWRQVTRLQVVPGTGRDAYIKSRAAITQDLDQSGVFAQLAGYRFVHYAPEVAVIQMVTRTPSSVLKVNTLTVRWVNGDWRLVLHTDGGLSPTVQQVASLTSFIVWGGI